ncbi:MAG: hypothetical protein MHM6MM_006068 [Cercozoa sp. M6MM]
MSLDEQGPIESRAFRVALADGTLVPDVELTSDELRDTFARTYFAAAFESDSSTNVILIDREEITAQEVQQFVRKQRERGRVSTELPTLAKLCNQRFLGEDNVRLFSNFDEPEEWSLTLLAAPIIDFHETICAIDELLGTCVGGLDMYTISHLLCFVNRVRQVTPKSVGHAPLFDELFDSLKKFSSYCEHYAWLMLLAKRRWQSSQRALSGNNDLSKRVLLDVVAQAKADMPTLTVPSAPSAVQKHVKHGTHLHLLPVTSCSSALRQQASRQRASAQPAVRQEASAKLSSSCQLVFFAIPVLPKRADVVRVPVPTSMHADAQAYRIDTNKYSVLQVPLLLPKASPLSSQELAARTSNLCNGEVTLLNDTEPKRLRAELEHRVPISPGASAFVGFRQPRLTQWVHEHLQHRLFDASSDDTVHNCDFD